MCKLENWSSNRPISMDKSRKINLTKDRFRKSRPYPKATCRQYPKARCLRSSPKRLKRRRLRTTERKIRMNSFPRKIRIQKESKELLSNTKSLWKLSALKVNRWRSKKTVQKCRNKTNLCLHNKKLVSPLSIIKRIERLQFTRNHQITLASTICEEKQRRRCKTMPNSKRKLIDCLS